MAKKRLTSLRDLGKADQSQNCKVSMDNYPLCYERKIASVGRGYGRQPPPENNYDFTSALRCKIEMFINHVM